MLWRLMRPTFYLRWGYVRLCLNGCREEKRQVIKKTGRDGVSFIDVGMGLELENGSLGGILRVTTSTPEKA